ncbi:hypothetical protein IX51_03935 [uncultured archaeon]|nr:hypothetical protein IX51_03935 [uncultured archaeon]
MRMEDSTMISALLIIFILVILISSELSSNSEPPNISKVEAISGVSVHNLTAKDVVMISDANFTWVRLDTWPTFGKSVSMASSAGIKVLGIIEMNVTSPKQLDKWNSTVEKYATNYDGNVSAWEILNEPRVSIPSGKENNFKASLYYKMVKSAYEIIKSVNSSMKVIAFGGIRILDNNILDQAWVEALVSMGILHYCDAVSIHLYSTISNAQITELSYRSAISHLKRIVGNEAMWVTETGMPYDLDPVAYINAVYPMLSSFGIQHIFWYEFRDWVPDFDHSFGLLKSDYTPRPAYFTFKGMDKVVDI